MNDLARNDLPEWLDVSRETKERFQELVHLVAHWNSQINLVAKSTLEQVWARHVLDSAQLWLHREATRGNWLDLGSGGGFPGLVIAIIAAEQAPDMRVTLVEADQRKTVFLREAARRLGVSPIIRNERIEALAPTGSDVLSARALASLGDLLGHTHTHMRPDGVALFLKGKKAFGEVEAARRDWSFDVECLSSRTSPDGVIVKVRNIDHV